MRCRRAATTPTSTASSARATVARYGRADLLIDELGYMELDRRGAELLSQVLTEREEKSSTAISAN